MAKLTRKTETRSMKTKVIHVCSLIVLKTTAMIWKKKILTEAPSFNGRRPPKSCLRPSVPISRRSFATWPRTWMMKCTLVSKYNVHITQSFLDHFIWVLGCCFGNNECKLETTQRCSFQFQSNQSKN